MSTIVSNGQPCNFNFGNRQKSGEAMFTVSCFQKILQASSHLEFFRIMQTVRNKLCINAAMMDIINTLFTFSSPAIIQSVKWWSFSFVHRECHSPHPLYLFENA
jgi:hypothetical protein